MMKTEEWIPFTWYCPNCGATVIGFKNQQGSIKLECQRCRIVMVKTFRGRRHELIEIYAPTQRNA